MTDDWTREIKARLEAATPGPWRLSGDWIIQTNHITRDVWNIAHCLKFAEVNRGFIAHAPTDIVNLLRERDVLRDALKSVGECGALVCEECGARVGEALAWKPKGMEEK